MMIPDSVAAVGFQRFGGPEVLSMVRLPAPRPGPGEVLIRVAATPVNPADTLFRSGGISHLLGAHEPPYVPGLELAGVVVAVGPDVIDALPDQEVIAITSFIPTGRGAQAAFVVVPAAAAVPAPAGCDLVAASTLPMNGLTARLALDRSGVDRGGTIVVTGAAGAVGGYVVQLAALEGLRVIALAARKDHVALRDMGASEVVPVRGNDVAAAVGSVHDGPVAAVVDAALLGPPCAAVPGEGGRIIALRPTDYGAAPDVEVVLISVREYGTQQARLQSLATLAGQGKLRLRVAATFAPDHAAEAHRRLDAGGLRGRPVLVW